LSAAKHQVLMFAALVGLASTAWQGAHAQRSPATSAVLVGAWTPQGTKCSAGRFIVVYLPDGRTYASMTPRGPRTGGVYTLSGHLLEERIKTMPAFRTNSPALARYENEYLTERRTILKMSASRIDLGFPGSRDPNVTTPPLGRCPEDPGVEPWFPRERYSGFSGMRKLLPAAN